jgi:hypothetical protein
MPTIYKLLVCKRKKLPFLGKLTNGTTIEINATSTQLRLKPGILVGGQVEHDCPETCNVGWFLEGILPLAPFLRVGKHASTRTQIFSFCHVKPTLRVIVHRYVHRREGDPMRLPGLRNRLSERTHELSRVTRSRHMIYSISKITREWGAEPVDDKTVHAWFSLCHHEGVTRSRNRT